MWYHRAGQIHPRLAASTAGAKQFLRAGCCLCPWVQLPSHARTSCCPPLAWAHPIPCVALGWGTQRKPLLFSCTVRPAKGNNKNCRSSMSKASERRKEDFFFGCRLIAKLFFDPCEARKCRCGVHAWFWWQQFSLRSNSCYVAIILGKFQGT